MGSAIKGGGDRKKLASVSQSVHWRRADGHELGELAIKDALRRPTLNKETLPGTVKTGKYDTKTSLEEKFLAKCTSYNV